MFIKFNDHLCVLGIKMLNKKYINFRKNNLRFNGKNIYIIYDQWRLITILRFKSIFQVKVMN